MSTLQSSTGTCNHIYACDHGDDEHGKDDAPVHPPGTFYAKDAAAYADQGAAKVVATTAYAQPAYAAPTYVAPTTTAYAQPAYAAPTNAAPATTADEQPPIIYSEGGVTVPLRATRTVTRQPSVEAELYQLFVGEVEFLELWVSKGVKPSTQNARQRFDKSTAAIEILNLICSHESANG